MTPENYRIWERESLEALRNPKTDLSFTERYSYCLHIDLVFEDIVTWSIHVGNGEWKVYKGTKEEFFKRYTDPGGKSTWLLLDGLEGEWLRLKGCWPPAGGRECHS